MKNIIINASPRPNGNCSYISQRLKDHLGGECSVINLRDMNIQTCKACQGCRQSYLCIMNDKMRVIFPELLKTEKIIFITPNHFTYISSLGKIFLDRWYCLVNNKQTVRFGAGKKLMFFLTQAGSSQDMAKTILEWAKRFFSIFGFKFFSMTVNSCSNNNTDGAESKINDIIMSVNIF